MVNRTTAATSTIATRTGYTYVNDLVTGATRQGVYSIIVDGTVMDDAMASGLTTTYGFTVTNYFDALGSYKRYKISWD